MTIDILRDYVSTEDIVNSGEIIEFVDEDIELLQKKVADKLGYTLVDHRLELYGTKKINKS